MENDLFVKPPKFKLYNDRAVYVGTFLGGPLVAGYIASENFKELGQPRLAVNSWIFSILATIIIFGSAFIIPGFEKVPKILIPILYSVLAQFLVKQFQGDRINEHVAKGGQIFSVWRAVLIGIAGLAITLALLLSIILITDNNIFS
jgi:hypothetical protein